MNGDRYDNLSEELREKAKRELHKGEPTVYALAHDRVNFCFQHRLRVSVLKANDSQAGEELFVIWLGHVEDKRVRIHLDQSFSLTLLRVKP